MEKLRLAMDVDVYLPWIIFVRKNFQTILVQPYSLEERAPILVVRLFAVLVQVTCKTVLSHFNIYPSPLLTPVDGGHFFDHHPLWTNFKK